ncbi:4-hydroxy-3-methylbut-2-enyl diphosphate reductase [Streptomyces sp. SID13031]|uniref:4-hydroxy-3-methylbut-2-enyl diphosphate reductase n=1 Tax=Streptomyces sp. SID13031 TaxID=2706046 RepID=UPI0013C5AEFF|nr:4-hydroxy-3-methylbut-2-enyl diphosphate reductase [Streptomyces sp. SID13031]NEA36903.1 4-hydroxy-3-methylbut-2-enyl diphosphate reductase [Streptomyces sp. SID13031]
MAGQGPTRRVLLASPRAFCAGVERAIDTVQNLLALHGPPIYVRKEIVHNSHVVADLRDKGAIFVDELTEVPEGARVVFSAHGVAPAIHEQAQQRRLDTVDATCPLVSKVHSEARRFAAQGKTILLVGHAEHEETDGTYGEAPDNIIIIETADDAATVSVDDPRRVAYLTQTTLATNEAAAVVEVLQRRFPELQAPPDDDICYATTNRQNAVRAVAAEADLVLVVGSTNSSNSQRLVDVARREGVAAWLIEDATQLRSEWFDAVTTIGLTGGASAPPHLLAGVLEALRTLGPLDIEERITSTESVYFAPPSLARRPHSRDE